MGADPDLGQGLAELNARIARHVEVHGTRHAFGTYVDPTSGSVVVETDAPRAVVDGLIGDARWSSRVVVRRASIRDAGPGTP